jgi:hypothetical protein
MGELEPSADNSTVSKERFDLAGCGICGDVEVLGLLPEKQISHPPADDVSLEARTLQPIHHLPRVIVHLVLSNRVSVRSIHGWLEGFTKTFYSRWLW